MLNYNSVLDKFKECKRLVGVQPEDERSYYDPHINTMRAVLEQPVVPTDILECIEKHADNLIKRLNDSVTPAAIRRIINSLPRFEDVYPSD